MAEQGRARIYAERPCDAGRHRQQRVRPKNCQHQMDNHCYRPSGKAPPSLFPCGATAGIDEGHDLPLYRRRIFLPEFDILVLETHHAFIFLFLSHIMKERETSRPSCRDWYMLLFMGQKTPMAALRDSRTDARPASCTAVPSLDLSARRQVSFWFRFTKAALVPLS